MADQAEFRLGVVGVVDGGRVKCGGCGYDLAARRGAICPACGFERKPYPAGSFQRFNWVFGQKIDATGKLVLLALAYHDMPNGRGVYPSHARLARMTGLSRSSVIRALKRLRKAGWVTQRKTRRRDGRQGRNWYEIKQPGLVAPGCHCDTLARVSQ